MKFLLDDRAQSDSGIAGNVLISVNDTAVFRINLTGSTDTDRGKICSLCVIMDRFDDKLNDMFAAEMSF